MRARRFLLHWKFPFKYAILPYMQVLFLQNVRGLGKVGEVKNVNDGYAQNFLFPKNLAELATPEKIAKLKNQAQAKVDEKKNHTELVLKNLSQLHNKEVELHRKVNSVGALFGGIHVSDIRDVIKESLKVSVSEEYIHLPQEIHNTGEFIFRVGDKKNLGKEFEMKLKVIGQ